MTVEKSPNQIDAAIQVEVVDPKDTAAVERFSGAHEGVDDTISAETRDHVHQVHSGLVRRAIEQGDQDESSPLTSRTVAGRVFHRFNRPDKGIN